MSALRNLDALDRALSAKRWPSISPWWRSAIERWIVGGRRQLVARVGRRGGKSSSLARFAVAFALAFDLDAIPPGDVGVVAFISVSRDEANQRLRTIKQILDALGVKYRPVDGGIELADRPIAFKVYTASIAGVSGFTSILVICDEVSKWRDSDTGANPAAEVLASVRPTMATQPDARIVLSSSPLGLDDAHAKAFEDGETKFQSIAFAETWIANPTVTEAQARDLEPNERVFRREYAAIPQASVTAVFDPVAVDEAMRAGGALEKVEAQGPPALVIDASRGGDAWTYGFVRYVLKDGRARLWLSEIGEVPDAKDTASSVRWLATRAKSIGATLCCGDQYEGQALAALFDEAGLFFVEHKWTQPAKQRAVDRIDRWLRDRELLLCENPTLRKQLHEYSERISKTGELTYGGRGRHDDYAAVIVTLAMADEATRIPVVHAPVIETKPAYGSPEWSAEVEARIKDTFDREVREYALLQEAIERDGGTWGD